MKKQRTRMRGFDAAQFVAFGTFPNIKNLQLFEETYNVTHNRFIVSIVHTGTGEIFEYPCRTPRDCTNMAKQVNKALSWYEESLKEVSHE